MRSWAPGGVCVACGGCGQGTRSGAWSRRAGLGAREARVSGYPVGGGGAAGARGGPRSPRGALTTGSGRCWERSERGGGAQVGRPRRARSLLASPGTGREERRCGHRQVLSACWMQLPELGLQWEGEGWTPQRCWGRMGGGSAGGACNVAWPVHFEAGTRPHLGALGPLPRAQPRPLQPAALPGPPPPGSARGTPAPPTSAPGRVSSALEEPGGCVTQCQGEKAG